MSASPGDRLYPPFNWLPDAALARLGRRAERLINAHGWRFDEFTPDNYLEGELNEATLHNFVADGWPVIVEAYAGEQEGGSATTHLVAAVDGQGDAHWHSSQLSGSDLDGFEGRVEAPDAGGLVQEVDPSSPCRITIIADFVARGNSWSDVEIDRLTLDPAETAHRTGRHADIEFRRGQNLGLYPSDGELEGRR